MNNNWGRYTLPLLLSSLCLGGIAAETKSKRSTKTTKTVAANKEVSQRLPRYFASIVDREQRTTIYEIQASYQQEIAKLQDELAALQATQLEEIEEVLTKDQLTALEQMRSGKSKPASKSKSTAGKSTAKKSPSRSTSSRKKTTSKAAATKKSPKSEKGK